VEIEKDDVCAVIIECIQGVGGIRMVEEGFIKELQALCEAHNTVLICDEIQCGYGRSGKFFAHQHLGIRPDMITVAKGICNGYPMGGVLISPKFTPIHGQLGTTFGGNHLGCAGAIAVLDVIESEELVENASKVGDYIMTQLKEMNLPHVVDVRGRGLMIGIELDIPYKEPRTRLIKEEHIFTGCSGTNVIRLLPPLCLTIEEANQFLASFRKVLS
jgi:acetylornithine aminotransferase